MNHSFDVAVAVKHGVHAAVLLQTISFWVLKNKANNTHLHDGRHWTYNSAKAFVELFPYLSADQIQRALKKLEDAGVLVTGCFNTSPYDRTRWYSTAEGCATDSADLRNEIPQDCGTYTNSNQFKPVQPPTPKGASTGKPAEESPAEHLNTGFAEFWKTYPKKVGKDAAASAWKRKVRSLPTCSEIMKALDAQKRSEDWTKDNGKFIPNPATWLNQGRWKDEAPKTTSSFAGVI